ncbi:MAG: hypothetical protein KAH54_01345 [Candidatus Sabulitectum sp.]|nr:hypothetical protein [Candidatus Sabulitectum sp.]
MRRKKVTVSIVLFLLLVLQSGCIDSPATTEPPKEFVSEFQLIWDLFDGQYVGFAVKDVNWDSIHSQYHSQAEDVSSREEMTELTIAMLSELSDYHIQLLDPSWNITETYSPDIYENYDMDVLMSYLEPWDFQWMQEDIWGYCLAGEDSIPYFVIASWSSDFNSSLFSNVLQPLLNRPGLILDIRMNPGGVEGPVNNTTRMFVDELRTGYLWQQRVSCDTHELSEPEEYMLHPRGWFFENPIVLLTGEMNSGVSEIFVCEMAELPHVTLMGGATLGATDLSVVYWELPESWYVSCPSRTILRPDSSVIEGFGIAPDVVVEATEADFEGGVDPILESAFESLGAEIPQ